MSTEPSAFPNVPPTPASASPGLLRLPGRKFWTVCFAVFSFEIGIFLTVFPWMDSWTLNHLPTFLPSIEDLWDDAYLKGALSGLGLLNVYVAINQIVTLIRERQR